MSKVTIIIPVYNLENQLNDTVRSVLNQTYKDLEILLIDDGSTDKSQKMCDEYEKKDSRIRVFHKKNGGVSSARNTGIEAATGEYIMFVDGDDLLEPDTIEVMLENINNYNSDMSICSKYFINENQIAAAAVDCLEKDVILNDEILKRHLCFGITSSLWLCLIKCEEVGNIRFDESIHALEDWKFLFDVFVDNIKSVSICRKPLYHYMIREESASHSSINERKMTCFNMVNDVIRQTEARGPEYRCLAESVEGRLLLHLAVIAGNCKMVDKKYNKKFKTLARKNAVQILTDKNIIKRQKIYILMLAISPKIYYFAYKTKYKVKRR